MASAASPSVAGVDDVAEHRKDIAVPALAVEDAVMADAGLHVMALHVRPQAGAEFVGGERLTDGADVVALAFDSEQRGAADGAAD